MLGRAAHTKRLMVVDAPRYGPLAAQRALTGSGHWVILYLLPFGPIFLIISVDPIPDVVIRNFLVRSRGLIAKLIFADIPFPYAIGRNLGGRLIRLAAGRSTRRAGALEAAR